MGSPNAPKAATGVSGSGPREDGLAGELDGLPNSEPSKTTQVRPHLDAEIGSKFTSLLAQLELAKRNLDERGNQLAVVADWKADLCARIARARLRYELVDTDSSEIETLRAEVDQFAVICRRLSWRQQ